MVAKNFSPAKGTMCGKKICETVRRLTHNPATSTGKEDEKTKESWWTKDLSLQLSSNAEGEIPAGEHELLQEGSLWIRNFSALKNSGDWQPLYFVLCTETLYYINKLSSPNTFSGAIAVKDISSIIPRDSPSDDGTDGHYIRVRTKHENFVLHWRSMERRDKWLTSLLYAKALNLLEQEKEDPVHNDTNSVEEPYKVSDLAKLCFPVAMIRCKSQPYTDLTF